MVSIVPKPNNLTLQDNIQFELNRSTTLYSESLFLPEANLLLTTLNRSTGFNLKLATTLPNAPRISLKRQEDVPSDGYKLRVDADEISLWASSREGMYYGITSMLQLFPCGIYSPSPRNNIKWIAPGVIIDDAPRFKWRGSHLDVSRHFMPKEFLLKWIDLLALHKLNVFHLHLTDDQGWRIEILKYPELTKVGAYRKGTISGHMSFGLYDEVPHGGYYTQEEIKMIVKYAAERHITVVPEIDMPGHMQAAIAAYPELGCVTKKLEVAGNWGVIENILNPKESTIKFMKDVLDEVIELFPSQFIHIGGDEAVKTQWENNKEIAEIMKNVGVSNCDELQSYFIKQMDNHLTSKGRRLIGWDEILEGGLASGATVMSWRGIKGGVTAAKQKHDVVMAPTDYTYLDYYQSSKTEDEPIAIGGLVTLEKLYSYNPNPEELTPEEAKHILGVQAQIWTEYMPNSQCVEYMGWPRLCALSEVAWTLLENKNYDDFKARLVKHLKRLDIKHVNYRPLHD